MKVLSTILIFALTIGFMGVNIAFHSCNMHQNEIAGTCHCEDNNCDINTQSDISNNTFESISAVPCCTNTNVTVKIEDIPIVKGLYKIDSFRLICQILFNSNSGFVVSNNQNIRTKGPPECSQVNLNKICIFRI